jgi:hypothetical protein
MSDQIKVNKPIKGEKYHWIVAKNNAMVWIADDIDPIKLTVTLKTKTGKFIKNVNWRDLRHTRINAQLNPH